VLSLFEIVRYTEFVVIPSGIICPFGHALAYIRSVATLGSWKTSPSVDARIKPARANYATWDSKKVGIGAFMNKNKESNPDGYLREEFRLFHIETPLDHEIGFHYHDFHKIFILISGDCEYWIEEKRYELMPLDAVIIPAGTLHRPVVKPGAEYKRIIIYISNDFFTNENKVLFDCFAPVQSDRSHLIRFVNPYSSEMSNLIPRIIEDEAQESSYGAGIIRRLRVTELLVLLNRALKSNQASYTALSSSNKTVEQIRDYIDSNLTSDLDIDTIAGALYLNRSYVMHLFKQETGTTIGNYITEKRMFLANKYIKEGHPKGEASLMAGFPSYSAFHYAFNKASASRKIGAE